MNPRENVNRICEHCDGEIVGNAYHVTSEYEGESLLDMTVCAVCASVAKSLALRTEEIAPQRTKDRDKRRGKLPLQGKAFCLLLILYSLFFASPAPAAAESQTWKVRPPGAEL